MFRQMEKLIELLNEYENRDLELGEGEESNARTENNGHLWFNGANKVQFDTYMFDSLALSKQYGFIKWLVENKKIDEDFESNNMLGDIFDSGYRFNDDYMEERLLCYLALRDNPIEFLVSILK